MNQSGVNALYTSRAGDQDGACAPTRHPYSPRLYATGIWYPLVGGPFISGNTLHEFEATGILERNRTVTYFHVRK
jgi:hypothetical protein